MATNYTEAEKKEWLANHPCRKQDGSVTIHRQGKCANCNCCFTCKSPPWCLDHSTKKPSKRSKGPDFEAHIKEWLEHSPPKQPRLDQNNSSFSPIGLVDYTDPRISARLEEYDEAEEERRSIGALLGNRFASELNTAGQVSAIRDKSSKIATVLFDLTEYTGKDEKEVQTIRDKVKHRLDPLTKYMDSLLKIMADLSIDGSCNTRRLIKSILLKAFPDQEARNLLLKHGYQERRRAIVAANKLAVNEQRTRAALKNETEPHLMNVVAIRGFSNPFSNKASNATSRRNFERFLSVGKDIPPRDSTTKIKTAAALGAAAFIMANTQYRPGKIRNCYCRGVYLKALPLHLRFSTVDVLYANYVKSMPTKKKIGKNSFRLYLAALTRKGTYQQGLSYYYVNHMDKMELVQQAQKRMLQIVEQAESESESESESEPESNSIEAIKVLLKRLQRQTELSSQYLRHRLYQRLQDDDRANIYTSVLWALGAVEVEEAPEFDEKDPLIIVLTLRPLLYHIVDQIKDLLDEEESSLLEELESIRRMADIIHLELKHYIKHLFRAWYQQEAEDLMKDERLSGLLPDVEVAKETATVFVTMDHKAKTVPRSKIESMTGYFGKTGLSLLGCMVQWDGWKEEKRGTYYWFFDIVMDNVTSQEAKDLFPCLEALLEELVSTEFKEIFSKTTEFECPLEVILSSDNALCHRVNTPFIRLLNLEDSNSLPVTDWVNREAQCGKCFIDSHFGYINKHLDKAIKGGGINLSDSKAFYKCLVFEEGMRASTAILLQENPSAKELFEVCNKVKYESKGISKVHHISWKPSGLITHSHFTNLKSIKGGYKEIQIDDSMIQSLRSNIDSPTGTVLKRSYSCKSPPLFCPFNTSGPRFAFDFDALGDEEYQVPKRKSFAGLLYTVARWVHSLGITPERYDSVGNYRDFKGTSSKKRSESKEIKELIAAAKALAASKNGTAEPEAEEQSSNGRKKQPQYPDLDPDPYAFPPTVGFGRYWAAKANKSWGKPSAELDTLVASMYNQGRGTKNKAVRYTAEEAVAELREGVLVDKWDQKAIITVELLKRKFSQQYRKDKDTMPTGAKKKTDEEVLSQIVADPEEFDEEIDGDVLEEEADFDQWDL